MGAGAAGGRLGWGTTELALMISTVASHTRVSRFIQPLALVLDWFSTKDPGSHSWVPATDTRHVDWVPDFCISSWKYLGIEAAMGDFSCAVIFSAFQIKQSCQFTAAIWLCYGVKGQKMRTWVLAPPQCLFRGTTMTTTTTKVSFTLENEVKNVLNNFNS